MRGGMFGRKGLEVREGRAGRNAGVFAHHHAPDLTKLRLSATIGSCSQALLAPLALTPVLGLR